MIKKSLFLFLSAGLSFVSPAQITNNEMSPAESFAARKGTILEKRFDQIGKVGYLNIQIEYLSDLSTNEKIQCVRFDIQQVNTASGPSVLLDSNEVNEIISFLKYISSNIITRPPVDPNTEISFTSKYNIGVGCFWQGSNNWTLFIRADAQNPATETDIAKPDIAALLKTLRLAKSELADYKQQ